jgi:nitrite reductase/ring-hydroxylating ferredoxin subunit
LSSRIRVCDVDELAEGERKIVSQGNVSIGVFNMEGDYHAILNNCSHQNGPLAEGEVSRDIDGEVTGVGEHVKECYTDDHMIVCPLHTWAFDLETGEHVGDSNITVPTFDVVEEDGVLYVKG